MMLLNGDVDGACELRSALNDLPTLGAALLDAGIELARGNFGLATALLRPALEENIESGTFNFVDDIGRLLRLVVQYGFGERLTRWLEETALADRVAPVYAALGAAIRGDSALRDVSPEVREPAITLLGRRARRSRAGP